eukprot:TRINITY_DN7259_c0_g1_i1.p1 TRINITY_DN7259_c0_g1~~TRINITY_DN7259_c0_g1_i1.p1  ORF type:complete len:536 (+),score=192.28 TRINITY_DN7259_c0_g1_i1:85-1608(+)
MAAEVLAAWGPEGAAEGAPPAPDSLARACRLDDSAAEDAAAGAAGDTAADAADAYLLAVAEAADALRGGTRAPDWLPGAAGDATSATMARHRAFAALRAAASRAEELLAASPLPLCGSPQLCQRLCGPPAAAEELAAPAAVEAARGAREGGLDYAAIEQAVCAVKPRWADLDPGCPWRTLVERLWPTGMRSAEDPGDDIFADSVLALLREEQKQQRGGSEKVPGAICAHVLRILRSRRHPAGTVLRRFGQMCLEEYTPLMVRIGDGAHEADREQAGEVGRQLIADVRQLTEALYCRLCEAFPFLDSPGAERWCVYCVEQEAGREVAPLLGELYGTAAADRNLLLNDALSQARDLFTLSDLVLDPELRLLTAGHAGEPPEDAYDTAVECLQDLAQSPSAVEQAAALIRTCSAIGREVAARGGGPRAAAAAEAAAAAGQQGPQRCAAVDVQGLIPVLTYVLIRSGLANVASQATLMLDWLPDELESDRAGACVAALGSAIDVACSLVSP